MSTKGEWIGGEITPDGYLIYDRDRQEDLALVYNRNDEHGDDETEANAQLIVTAVNQCQAVNPDNPQAVADAITAMYEALKAFLDAKWPQHVMATRKEMIKALTQAEGKENHSKANYPNI